MMGDLETSNFLQSKTGTKVHNKKKNSLRYWYIHNMTSTSKNGVWVFVG